MKKMAKTIAAFTLLVSTPAFTQVVQIESNNPAPKGHDPDRVVCEVEQTTRDSAGCPVGLQDGSRMAANAGGAPSNRRCF